MNVLFLMLLFCILLSGHQRGGLHCKYILDTNSWEVWLRRPTYILILYQ